MEIETGTTYVRAEVTDGVGVVTLNRPERRNALHPEMYDGVPRALEQFLGNDEVGSIVVTGAGTAFCAGGDVRDGAAGDPRATPQERGGVLTHQARMVRLLHESPKITIAALPGAAVGAGLSIALSTDLRIAAGSAQLVPGWGRLAFSGDFGGTWFLARLVGPSTALDLLIDGSPIDTATAQRLGLVNRVVPDGTVAVAALEWARRIASGPRTTWTLMKQNVLQTERLSLAEALPLESERMARSGQSDDHRRAVRAWLAEDRAKEASTRPRPAG